MATSFLRFPAVVLMTTASLVVAGCQLVGRKAPLGIPETALVPAASPIAVTLRTDWDGLAAAAPSQRQAWQAQVNLLKAGLQAGGMDYASDIQPWIGETATVAMVGLLTPESQDPGILLVTQSRDAQKSATFLEAWQSQIGGSASEIPGGRLFTQSQGSPAATLTVAQIKHKGSHYVLVGNGRQVIDQVLAVLRDPQNHPALSTHQPFLSLTQPQWDAQSWLVAHVNMPALIQTTGALQAFTDTDLDTPLIRGHLQGMQALSIRPHWLPDGVGVDYRIQVDPTNPWMQTSLEPSEGTILRYLPANALGVITTAYPAQIWQESIRRLQEVPEGSQMLAMAQGTLALTTGLDLERDVIGWMDGEVALAFVGDPAGTLSAWEGLLAIETSQKAQGEATWSQLDTLVDSFGGSVKAAAGGVVSWNFPGLAPTLQRFWADPYLVLTSNPTLGDGFRGGTAPTLDRSPIFASLLQDLPNPNYGYLLVQGSLVQDFAATAEVKWTPQAQQLWNSITAVGATSYRIDPATYAAQVRIQMND